MGEEPSPTCCFIGTTGPSRSALHAAVEVFNRRPEVLQVFFDRPIGVAKGHDPVAAAADDRFVVSKVLDRNLNRGTAVGAPYYRHGPVYIGHTQSLGCLWKNFSIRGFLSAESCQTESSMAAMRHSWLFST